MSKAAPVFVHPKERIVTVDFVPPSMTWASMQRWSFERHPEKEFLATPAAAWLEANVDGWKFFHQNGGRYAITFETQADALLFRMAHSELVA